MDKQQVLELMAELKYKPLHIEDIHKTLLNNQSDDKSGLTEILQELEQEGKIIRTRAGTYGLPQRMNLMVGRVQGHAKGFAFIIPDDKENQSSDVFVSAENINGAMHRDRVVVRLLANDKGSKREGEIIRILERATEKLVGTFFASRNYGFVVPDDKRLVSSDIFIPAEETMEATDGYKVVVQITGYPGQRTSAEGKVIQILGHINEPGVDILAVIHKHGIIDKFPEQVLQEAEQVADSINEQEIKGRRDLRKDVTFTIDGADAKDLDDAVSIKRLDHDKMQLGVHIADVSYYVQAGSEMDKQAELRGNSTYLVDRVVPMLPERLSNGICSLNPRVDRLTMTCEMVIDSQGKVTDYDIYPSVIRTAERLTYTNVNKLLAGNDAEVAERYQHIAEELNLLKELAEQLRERRAQRGAIDFDFEETKVVVDLDGKPIDIVKRQRGIAEKIIEECMLVANETVAEHFHHLHEPAVYRIHEEPDMGKLMAFNEFINNFGYTVKGFTTKVHPKALQTIIAEIKGTPQERIISTVLLRSMRQARYDTENVGHFGLASQYYTHFTSPIRRYADLLVHRSIRSVLKRAQSEQAKSKSETQMLKKLQNAASWISERERTSIDAERETDDMKKVEFMEEHVGEEFDGIITGVTNFGMFVELENSVEGLVHMSFMTDDYYFYHEKSYSLIGERSRRVYRIGDEVRVRVIRADKAERQLDLETVLTEKNKGSHSKTNKKKIEIKLPDVGGKRKKQRPTSAKNKARKQRTANEGKKKSRRK